MFVEEGAEVVVVWWSPPEVSSPTAKVAFARKLSSRETANSSQIQHPLPWQRTQGRSGDGGGRTRANKSEVNVDVNNEKTERYCQDPND